MILIVLVISPTRLKVGLVLSNPQHIFEALTQDTLVLFDYCGRYYNNIPRMSEAAGDLAAARREARRQKILARAGVTNVVKTVEEATDGTKTAQESNRKTFEMKTMFTTDSSTSQLQKLEELNRKEEMQATDIKNSEPASPPEALAHGQYSETSIPPNSQSAQPSNSLPPQLANLLQELQGQDSTLTESSPTAETDNRNFSRRRTILCFLLGIFIRLSFLSTYGTLYVQSALNPFVAYEVAVIGYQRAVGMALHGKAKGGMWMSALALSGVNMEVINTYAQVMGIMTAILDDFSVYFFAFTMTHLFL